MCCDFNGLRKWAKSLGAFPAYRCFSSRAPKLNHVGRGTLPTLAIDLQIGAVIRGDIWWIIPCFERHQKRSRVYDTSRCAWLR
jgi:hypothetical protein